MVCLAGDSAGREFAIDSARILYWDRIVSEWRKLKGVKFSIVAVLMITYSSGMIFY